MSAFLKGQQLWRIITRELTKPVQAADETKTKFLDRLDAWDGKNYRIITWFRNTSTTSIHLQFGRFQTDTNPTLAKSI